jgi:hypothetical protein
MDATAIGYFWLAEIVLIFVFAIASMFTRSGRDRSPGVWIIREVRRYFRNRWRALAW